MEAMGGGEVVRGMLEGLGDLTFLAQMQRIEIFGLLNSSLSLIFTFCSFLYVCLHVFCLSAWQELI